MSSPRASSLSHCPEFECEPYITWRELATSAVEFEQLVKVFHTVPKAWLCSAEAVAAEREARSGRSRDGLKYRLQILWNGVIQVQEGKFVCDLIESALRQALTTFCSARSVPCPVLVHYLRGNVRDDFERQCAKANVPLDAGDLISGAVTMHLTFTGLMVAMERGWDEFAAGVDGTCILFPGLRNKRGDFSADLRWVIGLRNDIAHTTRLVTVGEVRRAFETATKWLAPLHVDVRARVQTYRAERPRFLSQVGV